MNNYYLVPIIIVCSLFLYVIFVLSTTRKSETVIKNSLGSYETNNEYRAYITCDEGSIQYDNDTLYVSSGNDMFLFFKTIPIGKNEIYIGLENKGFIGIDLTIESTNSYGVILTKKTDNRNILRLFNKNGKTCAKFFNEHYLCLNRTTGDIFASRDHNSIFYFEIIPID